MVLSGLVVFVWRLLVWFDSSDLRVADMAVGLLQENMNTAAYPQKE